jgi:hypothetical protein
MSPDLIILYLALCIAIGVMGRKRRFGFWGFFFFSVILTPVITTLFLYFALPRRA